MLKLNLGCGLQCPEGWVNIDSSFGVRISKRPLLKRIMYAIIPKSWGVLPNVNWPSNTKWMNLTKRFKYVDNSVDHIYSSHTFEHFTYQESTFVLSECFRVMKSGGTIRLIVPDLEKIIESYRINKEKDPTHAAQKFHDHTLYFEVPFPNSFFGMLKFYFKQKNNHHFLYDRAALKAQLEKAGFSDIQFKGYAESAIPGIDGVDIKSRFDSAICLEGIKK